MQSAAYQSLHPRVQQLVLDLGWSHLHPVQEDAITCFRESSADFIVCAPTSGGKTEAVFLPLLSALVATAAGKNRSIQALSISPLKALINDQFARLLKMCKPLGIAVHRWHGDVDVNEKRQLRERPSGILLITPESIESLFVNYPHYVLKMFRGLEFVVVDELHALLEAERGMHIRSLLARLFTAINRRPRCIGLSATLGDPCAARFFLNQSHPESVRVISDRSTARPISVEVIAVTEASPTDAADDRNVAGKGKSGTLPIIAEDLRDAFNNGSYLVFSNSRRTVEELGDYFASDRLPGDNIEPAVALHHGSLSARLRRKTESLLKSGIPTRALCTSSLELGIDIGAIEAVAQIDPPWSVASLVQRLGRSGRRLGATSRLRLYVRIPPAGKNVSQVDLLYPSLLQAVAMVKLLLAGWLEPAMSDRMHLSTLVHQILSVLKESGGKAALPLYQSLCRQGPFRRIKPGDFKLLLQGMYATQLISQDSEGVLFLGLQGERLTSAPGFYAAFTTPVELTVRCGARDLGRLPASVMLRPGECLILSGRRWQIDSINWKAKTVWVSPTEMKQATLFLGSLGEVHDRVFQEMHQLLLGVEEPDWLESNCRALLGAAREAAHSAGLQHGDLLDLDDGVQWFPWVGTRTLRTLHLWAKQQKLPCAKDSLSLTFEGVSRPELERHLSVLAEHGVDAVQLAGLMPNKAVERFDEYVDEGLLDQANATDRLDVVAARKTAQRALEGIVLPVRHLPPT